MYQNPNPVTSYRAILDEQIVRKEIARREMLEAEKRLEKEEISWQLSLNKGVRRGGGGEPLRRDDGTIVANLRTFKRTANPNLPMGVEDDYTEDWSRYHEVQEEVVTVNHGELSSEPVVDVSADKSGENPPRRHVLFSHKYDSPEELESLAMRRRKQSELKEVLERQMAEKRERKAREKRVRELQEAKDSEEEERMKSLAGLSPGITPLPERARALEPLDTIGMSLEFKSSAASSYGAFRGDDGVDALENLIDSPIHATVRSSSEGFGDDAGASGAYLASHKEEREVLLRTIKDQDKEIESLLSKLQGVKEGRQLFVDTMVPESSPGRVDKTSRMFSPVKRSTARTAGAAATVVTSGTAGAAGVAGAVGAVVPDFTTPELSSSSEYVPMGGSSSTFYQQSLSPQKSVISSNILQSSFGLTAFEKTYRSNQYETRKEEALESFLQAFTEGTWR